MAHFKLIGIVMSLVFLTGCSSKQTYIRKPIKFEPHLVNQREWSVDKKSFAFARVIETLTKFCPNDDFYEVFEQNCDGLMASLFGDGGVSANEDLTPIILHCEIVNVHSKAGLFAFSNAEFAITIRFRLAELKSSGESSIAEITTEGRHVSTMGTIIDGCTRAHKRANLAIEEAFLSAQERLYAQLVKSMK